jgi:hypothetical protein
MDELLGRIKTRLADIDALLAEYAEDWAEEDGVYRFYHQSVKVFDRLRPLTKQGFELITEIGGEQDPPCEWYCQIVREGTEHDFNETTNKRVADSDAAHSGSVLAHEILSDDDGQIRQAARQCAAVLAEWLGVGTMPV